MEKVLITGASRGLGYELLKVYAARNNMTFPLVRSEQSAQTLSAEFTNCFPIVADLTDDDAINQITSVLNSYAGNIDILINNAGISGNEHLIENVRTEEVNHLFNIHCLGPIRTVKACLPFMRSSENPRIINVSSRLGSLQKMSSGEFLNRNFSYSYRMAKAAQNMFTICLSQEMQETGISVCAIHPGQLLTRGRSTDANTDPETAALNIYEWSKEINITSTGQYVQPFVGELPW
ncbi:NAD(P)-dependent dehydrogenase (short-subunit alcohol dehydrogenase family) [Paenibacillus castaneae]|uniref:SDR family NAD(P)-dependent oxidoreductase n=1 Tax=Paenibacillus castaneae TaxID=474957 RepID=UPI000C9AF674|nr:SDR family NAD(P)-dependent oxidoreductase [Paenibacillus castaneae]NIK80003.1 NAD(P)-dependent dehydrogenase (short-subunit alcohol dehydrogenase family) [Paenibacillus castaneae]